MGAQRAPAPCAGQVGASGAAPLAARRAWVRSIGAARWARGASAPPGVAKGEGLVCTLLGESRASRPRRAARAARARAAKECVCGSGACDRHQPRGVGV